METTSSSDTLPVTGQDITISLTLPDTSSAATETATGLITTGPVTGGDANIVIIYDASGSVFSTFTGAIPVGDANGDGLSDTILDAEFVAIEALVQSLIDGGFGDTNIGLVSFGSNAAIDFTGTASQDLDGNGRPDVLDAAASPTQGGGTNFERPLQEAIAYLTSPEASGTGPDIVYFLSDGFGFGGFDDEVQTLLDDTGIDAEIRAFGVGSGASEAQLDLIDDGVDNDSATIVLDPSQLQVEITGTGIDPASILNVELLVNGNLDATVPGGSLVSTPFGLQYSSPVNLDTTVDDTVVARVNVDQDGDGVADFSLETSQIVEQDGVTPPPPPPPPSDDIDIDIFADKDADFDIDLSFDSDIDYASDIDVFSTYDVDVDISGNEAVFNIDVQAFGEDTSTELDLVTVTMQDEWSSILATGYSAVEGFA